MVAPWLGARTLIAPHGYRRVNGVGLVWFATVTARHKWYSWEAGARVKDRATRCLDWQIVIKLAVQGIECRSTTRNSPVWLIPPEEELREGIIVCYHSALPLRRFDKRFVYLQ